MSIKMFAALMVGFGIAWSTQAADQEVEKELKPEQQQQRTALIKKYDANSDGVLDKTEFKKISKEDKKALAKLGGVGTAKKAAKGSQAPVSDQAKPEKERVKKGKSKSASISFVAPASVPSASDL